MLVFVRGQTAAINNTGAYVLLLLPAGGCTIVKQVPGGRLQQVIRNS